MVRIVDGRRVTVHRSGLVGLLGLITCRVRGIGHIAKNFGARAEVRLTRSFGSGRARRRRCGRERGVEVTVREQHRRRMKHESGEGETEICDMRMQQTFSQTLEPCVYAMSVRHVKKMCVRQSVHEGTIQRFETLLNSSTNLQQKLHQLSDKILLCHCDLSEPCHGDVLSRAWEEKFLTVNANELDDEAAQAEELFRAAAMRQQVEEPESQSEDEPGQAPRGSGWRGVGPPLTTGSG